MRVRIVSKVCSACSSCMKLSLMLCDTKTTRAFKMTFATPARQLYCYDHEASSCVCGGIVDRSGGYRRGRGILSTGLGIGTDRQWAAGAREAGIQYPIIAAGTDPLPSGGAAAETDYCRVAG